MDRDDVICKAAEGSKSLQRAEVTEHGQQSTNLYAITDVRKTDVAFLREDHLFWINLHNAVCFSPPLYPDENTIRIHMWKCVPYHIKKYQKKNSYAMKRYVLKNEIDICY